MGCGSSKDQATQNPVPAVSHPLSPRKAPPVAISKPDDSRAVWEDDRIMFDSDLEREAKCTRTNKWGLTIRPTTRDKSRPDDNAGMAALLAQQNAVTESRDSVPRGRLELEFMYGYSALDSRHNLYFAGKSEVVYPCSALGVVLDYGQSRQRFFGGGPLDTAKGHSDQILSLAVNTERTLAVTGEVGMNPKICVWRLDSPESGPVLELRQGQNTVSVEVLRFTVSGSHILACDGQSPHVLRIFDSVRGTKMSEEAVANRVLEIACGEGGFALAGVKLMAFGWPQGKNFRSEKAAFGTVGKMCSFPAAAWMGDLCLAGATNGQLYVFQNAVLQNTVQVLPLGASVHALCVAGDYILLGGNDNIVHELDSAFIETRSFPVTSCPRALDCLDSQIVCGLRDGSIVLLHGQEERFLMESHSDGDVWGLAVSAKQRQYLVTSGEDNKIKLWDCEQRKSLATGLLDPKVNSHTSATSFSQLAASQQSRAVALSRTDVVAIGHNDGHISVRKGLTQLNNIQTTITNSTDWIAVVAYSPDGLKLAAGGHDQVLRVYDAKANYRLLHALEGHNACICSIDWSASNQYLQTAAGDGEVLIWNATSGKLVDREDVEEETWATWTCKFGWQTEGVQGLVADGRYFNGVDRHPSLPLLAVANEFGFLQLHSFPCARDSQCLAYKAHSDRITAVRWSADGKRLFTIGGYDQCVAQWRFSSVAT